MQVFKAKIQRALLVGGAGVLFCLANYSNADTFEDRLTNSFNSSDNGIVMNRRNPVPRVMELLRQHLKQSSNRVFNIIAVPTARTKGDYSSYLVIPTTETARTEVMALVAPMVVRRLRTPMSNPNRCSNRDTLVECCQQAPDFRCIGDYEWRGGLFEELARIQFLTTILDLLSQEIANSSQIFSRSELQSGKLPGDLVWYMWRQKPEGAGDSFLATRLNASLVDRILTTVKLVESMIRETSSGVSASPVQGVSCINGRLNTSQPHSSRTGGLAVSRGQDSGIRNSGSSVPSTVHVSPHSSGLLLAFKIRSSNPIGGSNQSWLDFYVANKSSLSSCFGSLLDTQYRLLNTSETSVLLFYSMYLLGIWDSMGKATF